MGADISSNALFARSDADTDVLLPDVDTDAQGDEGVDVDEWPLAPSVDHNHNRTSFPPSFFSSSLFLSFSSFSFLASSRIRLHSSSLPSISYRHAAETQLSRTPLSASE